MAHFHQSPWRNMSGTGVDAKVPSLVRLGTRRLGGLATRRLGRLGTHWHVAILKPENWGSLGRLSLFLMVCSIAAHFIQEKVFIS